MKILHRGRLTWRIKSDSLLVYDKYQATLYAGWAQPRFALFKQMREFVLTSESTEYDNWVDVLLLAQACKVYGMGARVPIEES